MKISFHLPLEKVKSGGEFVSAEGIFEMARALEAAGVHACYVTEHPAPANKWLQSGGHHALDPFVALSFAAAATTRLRLHTNIIVIPYHNPFLTAKSVASLDVLSGGRLIMGIGSGYLQDEFVALNAPFEGRGVVIDEAIELMKKIWTGEPVTHEGQHFRAPGNTVLPVPVQKPHPPIWVGGNSERAIRRAVETCDGWSPFPVPGKVSERVRTDQISSIDDLRAKIAHARELEAKSGRKQLIDVCMVPFDLGMHAQEKPSAQRIVDQLRALAEVGVTWSSVGLPCRDRKEYLANVDWFAREVMTAL
ncbi:MAG TPA: LLM class F420-dependent oxidoreductase [Alphaproteobacteria bacterium]|nr:LLM class F420-dependent oxidoreductase [Alphaproteobacteria bacterium]